MHWLAQGLRKVQVEPSAVMATQNFKRNFCLNLYREGGKILTLVACFLLPLNRAIKNTWHLQPIFSIWRPLAFLPVTLSVNSVNTSFYLTLQRMAFAFNSFYVTLSKIVYKKIFLQHYCEASRKISFRRRDNRKRKGIRENVTLAEKRKKWKKENKILFLSFWQQCFKI